MNIKLDLTLMIYIDSSGKKRSTIVLNTDSDQPIDILELDYSKIMQVVENHTIKA